MKKHNGFVLIAAVGVIIAIVGVLITFFAAKKEPELSAKEHYDRGETLFDKKKFVPAFQHFLKAAEKRPDQADYHWKVVESAISLNKRDYAQKHAELAWNTGMKTEELLRTRVHLVDLDSPGKLKYALKLIPELPESDMREILRGDLHFGFGQEEEGLRIYKKLYARNASPELTTKMILAFWRLQKEEEVFQFINKVRDTSLLNTNAYHLLISLFTNHKKFEEIEILFAEAQKHEQYDAVLQLRHAILKIVLNQMDDGMKLMRALLEQNQLGTEIEENGGDITRQSLEMLHHQVRLFLAFFNATRKNSQGVHQLMESIGEDSTRLQEGEKLFYEYLLLSEKKKGEIPDSLIKAKKLLTPHPILELSMMIEENRIGKHNEALASYERLTAADRLTAICSPVVIENAVALAGMGRLHDAIYTLKELHTERNIYTKRSIELLRTYTQQAHMPNESWKMQELLFDQFGDDIDVQFSGGKLALDLGKWDKALEIFDNLADTYPEEVRFKIATIEVLLRKGNYKGVLNACKNSDVPKKLLAPLEALAYKELGRLNEAETSFEMAMSGEPSEKLQMEYAFFLYQLGKLQRSQELFEQQLKRNPRNERAQLGMAFIAFRSGNLEEAKAILNTLISENKEVLLARFKMAEIDLAENRPEIALSHCRYILQRNPNVPMALFMEGVCLRRLNRLVEAEKVLTQCLEKSPDNGQIAVQLALTRQSLKKHDKALALIDGELKRTPENIGLKRIRLNLLCLLKRFPEAEHELKLLKQSMSQVESTRFSAWLLEQQGKNREAIELLTENVGEPSLALYWAKLKIVNGDSHAIIPRLGQNKLNEGFWTELGLFATAKKNPKLAVECYRKAIERGSSDPVVLNNFAWYSMEDGANSKDEILSAARKAFELQPVNPNIMDTYVKALIRFGLYNECIAILEEKRKIIAFNSGLLMYLAKAYEKTGNLAKAVENYSQVLDTRWGTDAKFDPDALRGHVQELKEQM